MKNLAINGGPKTVGRDFDLASLRRDRHQKCGGYRSEW